LIASSAGQQIVLSSDIFPVSHVPWTGPTNYVATNGTEEHTSVLVVTRHVCYVIREWPMPEENDEMSTDERWRTGLRRLVIFSYLFIYESNGTNVYLLKTIMRCKLVTFVTKWQSVNLKRIGVCRARHWRVRWC